MRIFGLLLMASPVSFLLSAFVSRWLLKDDSESMVFGAFMLIYPFLAGLILFISCPF